MKVYRFEVETQAESAEEAVGIVLTALGHDRDAGVLSDNIWEFADGKANQIQLDHGKMSTQKVVERK
jgi:hypothetical protein